MIAAGIVVMALAATATDRLAQLWAGVRDSSEQVVLRSDPDPALHDEMETRVRTAVSRVDVPWLGTHVLYLEEYLPEDTSAPRRQVLMRLEPGEAANTVRAALFTLRFPEHWRRMNHSKTLLGSLRGADVLRASGCDLVLQEEGTQFRGGTEGNACRVEHDYVDYRTVIGEDLYWYRRRIITVAENELQEEVVAFNWFEPNDARLFTCRIEYSKSGQAKDRRVLVRLDLHDRGGHERFATPEGRALELSLYSQDGPFAADRDALILVLREPGAAQPIASAWTELTARQIALDVGWLTVRCGPLVPETEELES